MKFIFKSNLNEAINFVPIFQNKDGSYSDKNGITLNPADKITDLDKLKTELLPSGTGGKTINALDVRSIDDYIPSSEWNEKPKSGEDSGSGANKNGLTNGKNNGNNGNQNGKPGQGNLSNLENPSNNPFDLKNLGGSDDGILYIDENTGKEAIMVNGELVDLDEIYI